MRSMSSWGSWSIVFLEAFRRVRRYLYRRGEELEFRSQGRFNLLDFARPAVLVVLEHAIRGAWLDPSQIPSFGQ